MDGVTPHDLTAERAVLGAILLEPEMLDVALGVPLRASEFFRPAHRLVFASMARVAATGEAPDIISLRADLAQAQQLDEVGGVLYLSQLTDGVPRAVNVEAYARIVIGHAIRRDLIAQARQTIADAESVTHEIDELVGLAESRVMAVGRQSSRGEFLLASDWMRDMYRAVDTATSEKRVVTGVPTGLASIDRATRGFQPGELIIIAARPSVGKTSLALQFAMEASKSVFVAFVSMEMSRQLVGFRAVAQEARIDAFRIMTGHVSEYEQRRLGDAMGRLAERRIAIDDTSAQDVSALCAKVRRLASRHGLGALYVDYLQLMHAAGAENRTLEIGRISGRLKGLAKDLGIPVIALSQLTRENEREKRRPQLSDLRQSGDLEQDADVVILIHRPNKPADTNRYQPGEIVQLILAKQRNGPVMDVEATWDAPTMRFADVDTTPSEQGTLAEVGS